jgi:hypothetical protein
VNEIRQKREDRMLESIKAIVDWAEMATKFIKFGYYWLILLTVWNVGLTLYLLTISDFARKKGEAGKDIGIQEKS